MPKKLSDSKFLADMRARLQKHLNGVNRMGRDAMEERPAIAKTLKVLRAAKIERVGIVEEIDDLNDELTDL